MSILDEFPRLSSNVREDRIHAAAAISLHLDDLDMDPVVKSDYERFASQVGDLEDWPKSEQKRFRLLVQSVRAAMVKAGVWGADGYRLK